jgi:hypothetical protein
MEDVVRINKQLHTYQVRMSDVLVALACLSAQYQSTRFAVTK